MSSNSDNLQRSYSDQLSDLEDRLGSHFDDEAVLAEIHVAIKGLLSKNGASESVIREVLQKRLASGDLRRESFELVQRMLDRILAENGSTPPLENQPAPQEDVPYVETEVIVDDTPFVATAVIADDVPIEITTPKQIQVGSILRDRFLLQQQVTGGGSGVVYKALDQRLAEAGEADTYVAIKMLPTEISHNDNALRALQQEVAKGRCLAHPNIVRFIDLDREDDMYFIVMEWLDGKSLTSILDESSSKKIDLVTTMDIIKQVSLALDYAHQRGVIHGDINPGNVRITPEGEVKLFDFGVARILQKEQDAQPDFDPRELGAKSPEYSSMQVLTGEDPVPADDVFSLGCLMYRLLAGYRVFGPRSAADAASEGMEPQQPQGLSPTQWSALRKALAYSRVPRFSSPAEFLAAFGELPKSQPAQAESPEQTVPPAPPQQTAPPAPPQQMAPPAPPQQTAPPPPPQQAAQPPPPPQTAPPTPPPQAAAPAPPEQSVPPVQAAPMVPPAPLVVPDEPLVALRYAEEPRRSPWVLVILGIVLIACVFVGIKMDLFEKIEALIPPEISGATAVIPQQQAAAPEENEIVSLQAPDETTVETAVVEEETVEEEKVEEAIVEEAEVSYADSEALVEGPPVPDIFDAEVSEEVIAESTAEEASTETSAPETAVEPEVDYSALLPPTMTVGLAGPGQAALEVDLTLREDSDEATIDLVRMHNMLEPYSVLLEEVGFSGNRSPWEEGQYDIANNGVVTFEAGQNRTRTSIYMPSDRLREADREVTIQIREIDNAESELALIKLKLEDDDRRAFEASLPLNTIAFAASEVFVSEADPAVQIDLVRFKPDNRAIEVSYVIGDINATAGEDYFPPGLTIVYFGPGQRTARILIPLVQDAEIEGGEVFGLELMNADPRLERDIFQRIAVMIRDDD